MPTIEEKRRLTDIVLSRDEVRDVTGCAQRAAQRRELDALGIPYRVRMDGWPVVDRSAYTEAMGGKSERREPEAVLNWEGVN